MDAVNGKVEVYVDGGIRLGTDVFKALALGARAVFIGRPAIWGLAYKVTKMDHNIVHVSLAVKAIDGHHRLLYIVIKKIKFNIVPLCEVVCSVKGFRNPNILV